MRKRVLSRECLVSTPRSLKILRPLAFSVLGGSSVGAVSFLGKAAGESCSVGGLWFGVPVLAGLVCLWRYYAKLTPSGITAGTWAWRRNWNGSVRVTALTAQYVDFTVGNLKLRLSRDWMVHPTVWKRQVTRLFGEP